jgi:AhpD family alkylhydroperoxidase
MDFNKRIYNSPRELLKDLYFPIKHRRQLQEVRGKGLLSPAFRERLMLAVISVEGCRYCSYFHSILALKGGIKPDEIGQLLSGDFKNCPEDEFIAILYAQHWADSSARPDPEAVQRLVDKYGSKKAEAINLMLRMIRLGNLLGNTWDYFLYRITFGKWRR